MENLVFMQCLMKNKKHEKFIKQGKSESAEAQKKHNYGKPWN